MRATTPSNRPMAMESEVKPMPLITELKLALKIEAAKPIQEI